MASDWTISMFHYRNHGSGQLLWLNDTRSEADRYQTDVARVLVAVPVPPEASEEWDMFVQQLGYPFVEETNNLYVFRVRQYKEQCLTEKPGFFLFPSQGVRPILEG